MGLLEHIVIKTLKPAWEIMECFLEEEAFQLTLKRYGKVSWIRGQQIFSIKSQIISI